MVVEGRDGREIAVVVVVMVVVVVVKGVMNGYYMFNY